MNAVPPFLVTRSIAAAAHRARRPMAVAALLGLSLAAMPALSASYPGAAHHTPALCKNEAGSVQQLAEILNTMNGGIQCLGLSLQDGQVTALRIESHSSLSPGPRSKTDEVHVDEFPVREVESRHGAVLAGESGHDAVIVQGWISSMRGTAELMTRYLYNGFTGEYRSCAIRLARGPDAVWRLVNQFNQQVWRIVVKTRRLPVIGVIGIADLEGACSRIMP